MKILLLKATICSKKLVYFAMLSLDLGVKMSLTSTGTGTGMWLKTIIM